MSYIEHYEFLSTTRSLTKEEQKTLRGYSSRGVITSKNFKNNYSWGSFKGDPLSWISKYFDFYTYHFNHRLKQFKIKIKNISLRTLQSYIHPCFFYVEEGDSSLILQWDYDPECYFEDEDENEDEEWDEEDERDEDEREVDGDDDDDDDDYRPDDDEDAWDNDTSVNLAELIDLKREIEAGDLRPLYLGWLYGLQYKRIQKSSLLEPPVPPGLDDLSPAQHALLKHFPIDLDLWETALLNSPPPPDPQRTRANARSWLARFSDADKQAWLEDWLVQSQHSQLQKLHLDFQEYHQQHIEPHPRRRVTDILQEYNRRRKVRKEALLKKKQEAEALAKQKHEAYLQDLLDKEEFYWSKIEEWSSERKSYDKVAALIKDLREADLWAQRNKFDARWEAFRRTIRTRQALIGRIEEAIRPPSKRY